MAHIFISYKSETEQQALKVTQRLENVGIDCWIACRDIPVGTDYIDEIPMAIEACPFFILLLSSQIHISPWVKLELKQAISSGKHVLPLMLEDFKLHPSYTFMLQNYQVYPLFNDDGETFRDVVERIYNVLPQLKSKPVVSDAPNASACYQGDEPYIFVSYASKDRDRVMPIVRLLQQKGFRVWLDDGMRTGEEWSTEIAQRLSDCMCFLPFISPNYQNSHACRSELQFSLHRQKSMISVCLDDFRFSPGMQMQLAAQQILFQHRAPSNEAFVEVLSRMPVLDKCRER